MGWKNVKQHYGIEHIVRVVPDKGICIGSGYVHDIIVIDKDLNIERLQYLGRGGPFDGWVHAMEADKATLRRLIDTPDTFERNIAVYTYDYDGNIIEKQCEALGWPNCTHDGQCMYENTHSADRAQVVTWANGELGAVVDNWRKTVVERERELDDSRVRLAQYEAALAKLGEERQ